MKARVKATGEIIEIIKIEDNLFIDSHYYQYEPSDIEWKISDNDYWTRLEHQYAGMIVQGMVEHNGINFLNDAILNVAAQKAHALVEKLKEKEEIK